ncbi:MAG: FadR/GntR family transcriptional regulator [Lachnospiraceae bacterium]
MNTFLENQSMTPIGEDSVVNKVIVSITQAIRQGRFKTGQKLPSEYELMEELKISRTSLREAMKIMSAMGILQIKRGDGTYINEEVNPMMFDSLIYSLILEKSSQDHIVELRQMLDEIIIRLAIDKCTSRDISKLEEFVILMRKAFKDGEISKAAALDYQFHLYLIECSRNPLLSRIVNGVYQLFETSIEKNIRTEALFAEADTHHQSILHCIKSRDYNHVHDVVMNSLQSWRENIMAADL